MEEGGKGVKVKVGIVERGNGWGGKKRRRIRENKLEEQEEDWRKEVEVEDKEETSWRRRIEEVSVERQWM